ncbi:hypothetical protein BH24PSE2_BH24PSE2_19070 [soil metagenome]
MTSPETANAVQYRRGLIRLTTITGAGNRREAMDLVLACTEALGEKVRSTYRALHKVTPYSIFDITI